jgi:hypothetical protein
MRVALRKVAAEAELVWDTGALRLHGNEHGRALKGSLQNRLGLLLRVWAAHSVGGDLLLDVFVYEICVIGDGDVVGKNYGGRYRVGKVAHGKALS